MEGCSSWVCVWLVGKLIKMTRGESQGSVSFEDRRFNERVPKSGKISCLKQLIRSIPSVLCASWCQHALERLQKDHFN